MVSIDFKIARSKVNVKVLILVYSISYDPLISSDIQKGTINDSMSNY